ncbi:TIGR02680 family protein [Cohnella sp.]|uniref:TIGR02680 family protein n=1 Tax=Cohnella sp. TaxID=1883426 RepID=UPI003703E0DE
MQVGTLTNIEDEKKIHTSRWQMSRAGIFNFWHYDDEEFCLEEGRLVLRGTNGSGKSVTMQSFLPLVLDGDKRAQRLDPFGSRDRRMEYYLLGDADQGHTDRTGYLWLEFYHSDKQLYKTIGIGLRARRGVPQIGFWGFLIDDGRRINHDCWLYDHDLWLEQGRKLPFSRKRLEETIKDGGQVVQEQTAYRDMVNKTFFGFQDAESYQDLLKLLLELRSPKLSKDFKPSSMYEILTRALPPLHDSELSPLTDVLEDIDQITDRLEELQLHRSEAEKLNEKYDNYSRFLLKMHSKNLLKQFEEKDRVAENLYVLEKQRNEVEEKERDVVLDLERHKQQLVRTETELEILNRSEAMEKQRELEVAEDRLSDTRKFLQSISERISSNTKTSEKTEKEITLLNTNLTELSVIQNQIVEELEDLARMIEFREHDIYHGSWLRGVPEDEQWIMGWKKDLEIHRKRLSSALEVARKEREASRAAAEAEIRLGEIHKERNALEKQYSDEQEQLEGIKQSLREELVRWHKQLNELTMDGEQLRESLRAISMLTLTERKYDHVRHPVLKAVEHKNRELIQIMLKLQQQKELLEGDCDRIEQELQLWHQSKEPEPSRTIGRSLSREQRGVEIGAPLYAVCEFNSSLLDNERAQLEETLSQAGLLDAWIVPGGKLSVWNQEIGEEVWIEPNPVQGYTLAEVLQGIPSKDSGLSVDDIQLALNSIGWSQRGLEDAHSKNTLHIYNNGEFRLGPLAGRNLSKTRPEYIGKETRLRTKQLEIERLEIEKQNQLNKVASIENDLTINQEQQQALRDELEAFPSDKSLQIQIDILLQTSYRLTEILNQEERVEAWYKEKVAAKREIQILLLELTETWSTLKQEQSISEAVELCVTYGGLVSELSSCWFRYRETLRNLTKHEEQLEELSMMLEGEREERDEFEESERRYVVQVEQLKRLIKEMGIEDVHLQIKQLKEAKTSFHSKIDILGTAKERLSNTLAEVRVKVDFQMQVLNQCQSQLREIWKLWTTELQFTVIHEWKEHLGHAEDEKVARKLCKQITKEFELLFEKATKDRISNELQQIYAITRGSLMDYVLELDYLESGRIMITSKRDRANPLSLAQLLEEVTILENEQQILLTEKDRELYEEIILRSVGRAIRFRIHRAKDWVRQMNKLMGQRDTSSGLQLSLEWVAKAQKNESDLDTETLVELLLRDAHRLDEEEIEQVISHFRKRVLQAKQSADEEQGTLRSYIYDLLDYRSWFQFKLNYRKGGNLAYKELTDSKFNVLSGGEKAMAMYIPLFAATYSRYSDASEDAPKIISLDEAFAGVDDANIRDMFQLLTDMGFDYMMTSQVLWGCYDSVPCLAIYEIYRPKDSDTITLFHYRWDGKSIMLVEK